MPVSTPEIKPLTKAEQEILKMITEDFSTLKQIQIRRDCSRQAVYKILKSLKNKGALNSGLQKVDKSNGVVNQALGSNDCRLHGQEWNIKIIYQSPKYVKEIAKGNVFYVDGNTIKLYRNSIEIFAGAGVSFIGKDEKEADRISQPYWKKLIIRLENDLGIILVKNGVRNIKEVKHEYARTNSVIAHNAIEHDDKIRVFAEEDGKLAYITDDSWSFREDEAVHTKTGKQDRGFIDKHINDFRLRDPRTNTEIDNDLKEAQNRIKEVSSALVSASQVLEQLKNNEIRILKEVAELKLKDR